MLVDIEALRDYSIFLLTAHGGLPLAARDTLEEWYRLAKEYNLYEHQIEALLAAGSNWLQMRRPERALPLFHEALALVDAHGAAYSEYRPVALLDLALAYDESGQEAASLRYAQEVWRYIESGRPFSYTGQVALLLGKLHIARGEWSQAYGYCRKALEFCEQTQDAHGRSRALNNLGLICIEAGDDRQAEHLLNEALNVKRTMSDTGELVYTLTELGRLYYRRGDLVAAVHYSRRALQALWENVAFLDKAEVARLCRLFGAVAAQTGDRRGAISCLQRAITYFAQLSLWREWAESSKELDQVMRASGPSAPARVGLDWHDRETLRNLTTLLGIMDTLEGLYPDLRGKSELVTKYALVLADVHGVEHVTREHLSHAARLANIGSTYPSLEGGTQPAHDADEAALLADRVLELVSLSPECRSGIRHQHEWFDGTGHPDRLRGEEIPFISRVLAVAETYVTLAAGDTEERNLHQRAMQYLERYAGSRFDPKLVHEFARLHQGPGLSVSNSAP